VAFFLGRPDVGGADECTGGALRRSLYSRIGRNAPSQSAPGGCFSK
jgi:hypothetical protein